MFSEMQLQAGTYTYVVRSLRVDELSCSDNNGKTLTFDLCHWHKQMYCDACMHALLFVHLYVAQQCSWSFVRKHRLSLVQVMAAAVKLPMQVH